jgi:hypothetical protein
MVLSELTRTVRAKEQARGTQENGASRSYQRFKAAWRATSPQGGIMTNVVSQAQVRSDTRRRGAGRFNALPLIAFGLSLSLFFTLSFVLCVLGYLLYPSLPIAHGALSIILPGFQLNSWQAFFLGLVECWVWGWYISLVFGSLYNFIGTRIGDSRAE